MRRHVPLEGPELVAFFVLLLALWQFVDGQPARREDYQMSDQHDRAIGATGQVADVTFSRVYSVAPGTITTVQLVRRRDGSLAERIDIRREDGRRCTLGWSKRVLVLRQPTRAELAPAATGRSEAVSRYVKRPREERPDEEFMPHDPVPRPARVRRCGGSGVG